LSLIQVMPEDHINELRDIVFWKIGRNLVNFQRFELALKFIIVKSDLRGYPSELAKIQRDKAKDTDRKPLGWLVQDFFKTVYSKDSPNNDEFHERDEVWMSFSLRIESDQDSLRKLRRELREVVRERNLLIHRLLANYDPDSVESCKKLISLLDEQNNRLEPHYQRLIRIIGDLHVVQEEIFKQFVAQLRVSEQEE